MGRGVVTREAPGVFGGRAACATTRGSLESLGREQRGTLWRVWQRSKDQVSVHLLGVAAWRQEGWEACVMERGSTLS